MSFYLWKVCSSLNLDKYLNCTYILLGTGPPSRPSRLTDVFRLTGILFRLTGVLFRLTGIDPAGLGSTRGREDMGLSSEITGNVCDPHASLALLRVSLGPGIWACWTWWTLWAWPSSSFGGQDSLWHWFVIGFGRFLVGLKGFYQHWGRPPGFGVVPKGIKC